MIPQWLKQLLCTHPKWIQRTKQEVSASYPYVIKHYYCENCGKKEKRIIKIESGWC